MREVVNLRIFFARWHPRPSLFDRIQLIHTHINVLGILKPISLLSTTAKIVQLEKQNKFNNDKFFFKKPLARTQCVKRLFNLVHKTSPLQLFSLYSEKRLASIKDNKGSKNLLLVPRGSCAQLWRPHSFEEKHQEQRLSSFPESGVRLIDHKVNKIRSVNRKVILTNPKLKNPMNPRSQ